MLKWLIQDVGKEIMLRDNFSTVKSLNFNYKSFGVIGEKKEISNLENILESLDDKYIIRGGVKIISLLENENSLLDFSDFLNEFQKSNQEIFLKKLKSGIFYDIKKFDQLYYSGLDLPLLNKSSFFEKASDVLEKTFDKEYFVKPSRDLKAFLPGILLKGQTILNFILNSAYSKDYENEIVLFAPIKKIYSEYRFFVIDKTIITGSQYKLEDKIISSEKIPEKIIDCAKEYAQLYQPHEIFTMDLADTEQGIKIVEYNCWNGSGLYKCDKIKLFSEVNEYVKEKMN